MDRKIKDLLQKAFFRCPGVEANEEIFRLREEYLEKYGGVVAYELVLDGDEDWLTFRSETLPRFIDFIRCKGYDPLSTNEVFLPIFSQGKIFFLRIEDFIAYIMETENLTKANFVNVVNTWHLENEGLEMLPVPLSVPLPGGNEMKEEEPNKKDREEQ